MKFITTFLRKNDVDLRPSNSEPIDIESARTRLYPGAHVAAGTPYEHFHHGIVIDLTGIDITIVHYWGAKKSEARVQATTLPIFAAGGIKKLGTRSRQLYIVNYEDDTPEKQRQTCELAKELLKTPDVFKYNIFTQNCEGFAYFCRMGQWKSEQATALLNCLKNKPKQLFKTTKHEKKSNVNNYACLFKIIPNDVLSPTDRDELIKLCEQYSLSV
ncbi:unnamed protein product [Adineta steineri]|uniref:LRAT domain-containing protein n=1 Tax=Adineta steineri TaxID=433720 RepID=A0A813WN25_9BILA|nr:unnamed protein product [Adineta steineri]CAF1273875.1 unnamed protein product [Adineta steineri]